MVERVLKQARLLAQALFHPLALTDVDAEAEYRVDLAIRVADRHLAVEHIANFAVLLAKDHLDVVAGLAFRNGQSFLFRDDADRRLVCVEIPIGGVQDFGVGLAQDVGLV